MSQTIVMKVRGVDVSIDYQNSKVWFDDELPQEVVNVIGKYLVDEGFIEPKENTDFYEE
tara:strand:+ start:673 stop:849 length:177 start_codon:yes stop_codon:yes gene_type:complete